MEHIISSNLKRFQRIQQKSAWVNSPRKCERRKNHENFLWNFHFFSDLFLRYVGQKQKNCNFFQKIFLQNIVYALRKMQKKVLALFSKVSFLGKSCQKKMKKMHFLELFFFKNTTCLRSKSSRTYGTPLTSKFKVLPCLAKKKKHRDFSKLTL